MTPTDIRLKLRASGYDPIPAEGKVPPMEKWQEKFDTTDDEIRLWPKTWHFALNTGCLARRTPGADLDITDEDAAEALAHLAREHFEERGTVTARIGQWPKRLIPLRTDEPFAKMTRAFRAPDRTEHKIEVLCDGQHWVAFGEHPTAKVPYRWTHGEPGVDIARAELPYVRREDMEQFLDAAETLLIEQHGFTLVTSLSQANVGPQGGSGEPLAPSSRVAAAARVISNDDLGWDDWNRVGMAIWAATNGSAEGFEAFDKWSQKSRKYDARITSKKWSGYVKSPPTRIGFGTLKYLADQADPTWQEALRDEPPEPDPDEGHWHGEVSPSDSRTWVIHDLVPEVGKGLIAGQWGTFKTFTALEMAHSMMSSAPFLGFDVVRQGGVAFFALEGQSEIPIRLQALIDQRGLIKGNAPFVWYDNAPTLLAANAVELLVKRINKAAAKMQATFGLPLVAVFIDTIIVGAGYTKDGADNDTATTNAVLRTMAQLARRTGCFVFGIDHFGKNVDVGTRGNSVKEGNADVVLALLGEKSVTGEVSNCRLALRKRRSGANGQEFHFTPRVVDMGCDQNGRPTTTLVLDWGKPAPTAKPGANDWGKGAGKLLRQIVLALLADCAVDLKPFANGPMVKAIDLERVRAEFFKRRPAEGDSDDAKRRAKRIAFQRAVTAAVDRGVIATRDVQGVEYLWLTSADAERHANAGG
jgi:hypothetical protein